jgi:hypothetical protein
MPMSSGRGQEADMADATDTTLASGGDTVVSPDGAETDAVDRLTAHLMALDLDAQTLEMVMAALTVDVCDHVDPTDA